jgi:hypothetical protein
MYFNTGTYKDLAPTEQTSENRTGQLQTANPNRGLSHHYYLPVRMVSGQGKLL